MPLKKNDQIVIVAAIVVIIVAGIGIFLYTSPSTPDVTVKSESGDTRTYEVSWMTQTGSIQDVSEYAGKKAPFEGTLSIPHGNLKSITFNMSWVDDKSFLGIFGLDTLYMEVTAPDGSVVIGAAKSMRRTKAGDVTVTFENINNKPSTEPISAVTIQDAQQLLTKAPYYSDKWVNQNFKITVSVTVGEFLGKIRPRDKGNDFTIKIDYDYYSSIAQEAKVTSLDDSQIQDLSADNHPNLGLIISTGNFGRW